jgi:hypothetical protein
MAGVGQKDIRRADLCRKSQLRHGVEALESRRSSHFVTHRPLALTSLARTYLAGRHSWLSFHVRVSRFADGYRSSVTDPQVVWLEELEVMRVI